MRKLLRPLLRGLARLFFRVEISAQQANFKHERLLIVAGAEKLSEAVRSLWFENFGLLIFEGYGATEMAPVLAVNTPMAYRTGTAGNLLPSVEYKLVPVPGITGGGILHVRGPNVMAGYLKADQPGVLQAPVPDLGEGCYETGVPELAVPRKIHQVEALPLLGTGKVDYVTLKWLAEAV